jgi:hypothetical protein
MFDTPGREDSLRAGRREHALVFPQPEVAEVLHPNYMVTHIGVQFIVKHYFPVFQVGVYFLGYETTQKSFRI